MLKRILSTFAISVGITAAVVPAAAAAPEYYLPGPQDSTAMFVSGFDPAAYSSRNDAWLVVSPYGTSQPIQCAWFRGQVACSQTDLWGNSVNLQQYSTPFGSSTYSYRPVFDFMP